jgi:hypothetical protein
MKLNSEMAPRRTQTLRGFQLSLLSHCSRLLFVGACLFAILAGIAIFLTLALCALFDMCFARDGLNAGFKRVKFGRVPLSRSP